jgi:hypothetical protein
MPDEAGAFSSQVITLGSPENATRQNSIFKPSDYTWLSGKCDETKLSGRPMNEGERDAH